MGRIKMSSDLLKKINKQFPELVKAPNKSKFNVSESGQRTHKGKVYDSKAEMSYRRHLEKMALHNAPELKVVKIEEQVAYEIIINEVKICNYYLDFKVTYGDGRVSYVDVKGYSKGNAYAIFRLKKKLVFAVHGIIITEVKKGEF